MVWTRAGTAVVAAALVALVCVAAAVAAADKIKLRIDAVSHTYGVNGSYLCARVSGTAGSHLLVEAFGPGIAEGHAFTEALLPRAGSVVVGFSLAAPSRHRIKVTANLTKKGRSVATKDYDVPASEVAPQGRFSCTS